MENLGEQIYKYRTAKGLSQLELAELLDVSRQSISKWETNVAVPELTKLVKMAEVFEITLDELILDKKAQMPSEETLMVRETVRETMTEIKREEKKTSVVKTVFGAIFLAVGIFFAVYCLLFGDVLAALAILTPFLLCGIFCLKQFRFAALWCVETWFVYAAWICYDGMSITWDQIWRTSFILSLEGGNPMRVAVAWVLAVVLAALIAITVLVYRKQDFQLSARTRIVFTVGTFAILPLESLIGVIVQRIMLAAMGVQEYSRFMSFSVGGRILGNAMFFFEVAAIAAFTVFLVPTFYYVIDVIRENRAKKTE